MQKNKLRN